MADVWPDIPLAAWKDTRAALHQWLQIAGKYKLALTPWVNHSWHATFRVNARGLTSSVMHSDHVAVEILFDFIDHELLLVTSRGDGRRMPLEAISVAEFFRRFRRIADELDVSVEFDVVPNEIPNPVPFSLNEAPGAYDRDAVRRFFAALVQVERVLERFRTGFLGKVSPVHLFWGSFDLAVTRFSGRKAPRHPGGVPGLPDRVTVEAYSHEVSSTGFWPGDDKVTFPAFYAYAYPTPIGFGTAKVEPAEASFDKTLKEFLLPYDVVRKAGDPDAVLLSFLQSTYDAAANLMRWDRKALECPLGKPGVVREV